MSTDTRKMCAAKNKEKCGRRVRTERQKEKKEGEESKMRAKDERKEAMRWQMMAENMVRRPLDLNVHV